MSETVEVKSEYRCRKCGHFCASAASKRNMSAEQLPKRCNRCRTPWPLGTPEEWVKKHA